MNCVNHLGTPATVCCGQCGKPLCDNCRISSGVDNTFRCKECIEASAALLQQPPKKKKSKKIGIIVAVIAVILVIVSFGGRDQSDEPVDGSTAITDTNAKPAPKKTEPETKQYDEGVYKIGVDLPEGEYILICTDDLLRLGYMCVSSDSNSDDIILNTIFSTHHYITVENGQYLELSDCIAISAEENSLIINDVKSLSEGMYMVGRDIPAGEYRLVAVDENESAYSCIYDNSTANRNIVSNDIIKNNSYVTVTDGQYLLFTDCTASLVD